MDYLPLNLRLVDGEIQGDYGMLELGPYDYWAIEYGYSLRKIQSLNISLASASRIAIRDRRRYRSDQIHWPDAMTSAKIRWTLLNDKSLLVERFRKKLLRITSRTAKAGPRLAKDTN